MRQSVVEPQRPKYLNIMSEQYKKAQLSLTNPRATLAKSLHGYVRAVG